MGRRRTPLMNTNDGASLWHKKYKKMFSYWSLLGLKSSLVFVFLITPILSLAQYQTTVKAYRPILKSGDKRISREQIQGKTLNEVFNLIPEIQMPLLGNSGQLQSVLLDGSKSEHVLVLLDGVPLNDVGSTAGAFDFSSLDSALVDEIIVRKGSRAVERGGDALAGVIEIYTQDPSGPWTHLSAKLNSESNLEGAAVRSADHWLAGISGTRILGPSAASAENGNREKDSALRSQLLIKATLKPSKEPPLEGAHSKSEPELSSQLVYLHSEKSAEYDLGSTPPVDDFNARSLQRSDRIYWNGHLAQQFKTQIYFARSERNVFDPADQAGGSFLFERHSDQRWGFASGRTTETEMGGWHFKNHLGFQGEAVRWQQNSEGSFAAENNARDRSLLAAFFQPVLSLGNKSLSPGIRCDSSTDRSDHSKCDWQSSLDLVISQDTGNFYFSVAGSQRRPSFYQLYSSFGDEKLKTEQAQAVRLGFEADFFQLEASRVDFQNLIDFDSLSSKYKNFASVKTESLQIQKKWADGVHAFGAWTRSVDGNTGLALVRRAPFRAGLGFSGELEPWKFALDIFYKSKTEDNVSSSTRIQLDEYVLINATARYSFSSLVSFELQALNLGDQKSTDAYGYSHLGRTFSIFASKKF